MTKLDAVDLQLHLTREPAQVVFVNFVKFVRALFLNKVTGQLLLIIEVSKVVKGELVNETANYDTEIKHY